MIAVLVIVALPEGDTFIEDEMGDPEAFDEPTYVTNSEMGFFYKNDQLSTYREQQRPEKVTYFKMSDNIVTTDFTKNEISVVPDIETEYTGPRSLIVHENEVKEFVEITDVGYILKGGESIPKEDASKVILDHSILGHSGSTPHLLMRGNTYHAAFTAKLESMYYEFYSANEFVSIEIGGLSGRVEYTLLNESMEPIKNGWNNAGSNIEIQYKGTKAARYFLKLTGSYSEGLTPYTVKLPSDNNEWMWQMVYPTLGKEISGKVDYYGDADYYVLPPEVTENINKSVLRFTAVSADTNVVIYDKDGNIIGQYVHPASSTDVISMYGLESAFAIGIYSYDGSSSGTEYKFVFEHTEITLLDIETYGFVLSPGFSDKEDYYTASVKSLENKKITDVMHSMPDAKVSIKVKQQLKDDKIIVGLGEELPLAPGRNTVTLTVDFKGMVREITIVISDNTFDLSLTDFKYAETSMPEYYREKIEALKRAHPNWKFTFVKTGWDYNSYVRSQLGRDSEGTPNATYNGKAATEEQVRYYTDPRNFLTEQSVFMFEKQIYAPDVYSIQGVKSVWNDDVYAQYIMDAAMSTGVSPYFIVARAGLESGYGTSKLASGTVQGCEGYYNFYGIHADNADPKRGAIYAKEQNWNSRRRAIIEGAAWIKNDYIAKAQYTIYFMKYCFRPGVEWHQYMTDVAAPYKDAQSYYKAHVNGGSLNNAIEFVIPVFDNMPIE